MCGRDDGIAPSLPVGKRDSEALNRAGEERWEKWGFALVLDPGQAVVFIQCCMCVYMLVGVCVGVCERVMDKKQIQLMLILRDAINIP